MSAQVPYAKSVLNDRVYHINEVPIGSKEEFICCECKNKLISVKTERRGKDWHFRHPPNADISKCRSTALHDFAVQVLMNNNSIVLSKHHKISYSVVGKEVRLDNDYRSDVTVKFESDVLHFEVFVTHDMEQHKQEFYESQKIKCCRIDLSEKELLTQPPEYITNLVLNEYKKKSLLGWELVKPKQWYEKPEYIIPIIIAFFVSLYAIFKPRNKGRKK